jgi:hypothetical protein
MAQAQEQFRMGSSGLAMPFSSSRVAVVLPRIKNLLFEAMVGVQTPEQAAQRLLDLGNEP